MPTPSPTPPTPTPTPPTARSAAALAADMAARVARRDPQRLAAALTPTARLRALLPGGPVEAHGRENVAACLHAMFADFDSVEVVAASGEPVADRHLIHYRLLLRRAPVRWVCTQTAVCRVVEDRLAVVDLLCSGFREIENDADVPAPSGARLVG